MSTHGKGVQITVNYLCDVIVSIWQKTYIFI